MCKFKVGDKVVRTHPSRSLRVGQEYTVRWKGGSSLSVEGSSGVYEALYFEAVDANKKERQALSNALDLMAKYNIRRDRDGWLYTGNTEMTDKKEELLNHLFPQETEGQKKLRELEEQQRAIADQIAEIRENMK